MELTIALLKKAGLKAAEAKRMHEYLVGRGIATLNALENSPLTLGTKLFGHDIYVFTSAVVAAAYAPEPAKVVEPEPVEVEEPEPASDESE